MDRKSHYLRSTTGDTYPTNWIAVDIAIRRNTYSDIGSVIPLDLVGISAVACRVSARGNSCIVRKQFGPEDDFWAWVKSRLRRGSSTWLVSMQAMLLCDLTRFWDVLESQALYMQRAYTEHADSSEAENSRPWEGYAVTEDPPTIIVVRHPQTNGTLKIVDVRNYGIQNWASLGWAGLTDGAMEKAEKNGDRLLEHVACERAEMLHEFIAQIRGVLGYNGFGSLQSTAASQALYTFKRKFLRDEILIDGRDEIHDFEGKAYFSGRNEARLIGRVPGPVVHLDVNSHYLACCVDALMPVRLERKIIEPTLIELIDASEHRLVIADVTLTTQSPAYPYRDEQNTIFPIGRYRTIICGPELNHAIARQRVAICHSMQVYEGRRIFESWCDSLWTLRKQLKSEGKQWAGEFVKRIAVSLFGKFGQRSRGWVDCPEVATPYAYRQWAQAGEQPNTFRTFRALAWRTQELTDRGWAWDAIPAVAAFVTSYGRSYLWYLLNQVGLENVWYYDTDSIWCSTIGYNNASDRKLIDNNTLGKLKFVEVVNEMEIFGLKNYRAGKRRVCAGASRRLAEYLGPDGVGVTVQRIADSLKVRSKPTGVALNTPPQELVQYHHGELQSDGSIRPIDLPRRSF